MSGSPPPKLYLVADHGFLGTDDAWLERLAAVCAAVAGLSADQRDGVMIQLRAKDVAEPHRADLLARGFEIAQSSMAQGSRVPVSQSPRAPVLQSPRVPVLMNGTAEQAASLGFHGVHWPEAEIPAKRQFTDQIPGTSPGPRSGRSGNLASGANAKLLSGSPAKAPSGLFRRAASVHSLAAAQRAGKAGADFVVYGPIWDPGSKRGHGVGLGDLERFSADSPLPVVAIGGVGAARARSCLAAGAVGVAVVSAVFGSTEPTEAIEALLTASG